VFSQNGLDLGTRMLLLRAPVPATEGHLLDLGCGVGPIAITLAKRNPGATVWAVDVNERALALCQENALANDTPAIRVVKAEQVPDDVRFEAIWSNPPIHIGKPALHQLLLRWLPLLTPTGAAMMVVQKHLGSDSLQSWLTSQGFPTERIGSAKGYRLLRAVKT
jgi:16S rRNA (guanine1207-N2)-methyltransferase